MNELEQKLKSLINNKEFTSIYLTWNEDHSCMYEKPEDFYDYDSDVWVSREEFKKAMKENSVWSLQWYPDTPVGSYKLYASSIKAIFDHIESNK